MSRNLALLRAVAWPIARSTGADFEELLSFGAEALAAEAHASGLRWPVVTGALVLKLRHAIIDALRAESRWRNGTARALRRARQGHSRWRTEEHAAPDVSSAEETVPMEPSCLEWQCPGAGSASPTARSSDEGEAQLAALTLFTQEQLRLDDAEATLMKHRQRHALAVALTKLPRREREVVALHYFQNEALAEVARRWGLSRARLSRIHTSALRRLRGAPGVGEPIESPAGLPQPQEVRW
jgi:RNA polymerase sigma factor for flagellar operon FliA